MSTRLKEKEEKILQILSCLAEESAKGTPIVVEGKKDIEALRNMGIQGKILSAKTGGKTLLDVVSEIEKCGAREVILLFDFDRRGEEWTKRLTQTLERARIKVNIEYRHALLSLIGRDIKDVESLTAYMETLKSKICNS
ncbi:MAG: toprim domain-containing protein [Candidatus Bathyarchaeia archaeon]